MSILRSLANKVDPKGFPVLGIATGLFGIYTETMTTGREYGYGAGFVVGASYNVPYLGAAMMAFNLTKTAGDAMYTYQMNKRKSSFTRGSSDPFGNTATMRARSQYNLSRGRASLGNEAYLFRG